MAQLALVPHGSAAVARPDGDATGGAPSGSAPGASSDAQVRQEVHSIFETYAAMYPNPSLSRERQERDELQRAEAAASHASRGGDRKKRKVTKGQAIGGFFNFLWRGQTADDEDMAHSQPEDHQSSEDGHRALHLGDHRRDHRQYPLLGTDSLDLRCVPSEAHALVRFHLASTRTRGERPNVARPSWQIAGTSVLVVTGLGELVELAQAGGDGRVQHTSDRQQLQSYVGATDIGFHVSYVRAATVGPNLLVVSWGLPDGLVVFYRRLVGKESISWEAIACLSASEAVKANVKDAFREDFGSAVLRITGVVPLIFAMPEAPPAAFVAISRLGGYIEIVKLPTGMWYGPEIEPPKSQKTVRRDPKEHYASTLRDLAADPRGSIVALTTAAHTSDCICLESFRTTVTSRTSWDSEAYPDAPPAEYVLAAAGISTRGGGEAVCFWSIQACQSDETETAQRMGKFGVSASLIDAILVGPVGPEYTVFVNQTIMSLWRRPRHVRIPVDESSVSPSTEFDSVPVTTISVPAPIVAMCFTDEPEGGHYACFLDWNGGCMIADCRLLSCLVSHTLTPEQFDLLFNNDEEDIPLVTVTVNRSQMALRIGSHRADDIQFLGGKLVSDKPLLAVAVTNPRDGLCLVSPSGSGTFSMDIPASRTSLLRYRFSGLVLASSCISDGKSCLISTSTLKFLDNDDLDSANKKLWEETSSIESLQNVSDAGYIIEQALSMALLLNQKLDDAKCFDLFRSVHCLALTRIGDGVAPSAGDYESETKCRQLVDRLVRWGTFQLLCGLWSTKVSYARFISDFLPMPVPNIAMSLARASDIDALSILWFRHSGEIQTGYDILNEITPTLSPRLYSHMLPVYKDGPKMFLAVDDNDGVIFRNWQQFPEYLKDVSRLMVTFDADDHSLVLSRPAALASTVNSSVTWYANRVRYFLAFGSSIENTTELCLFGLEASPFPSADDRLQRMLIYLQRLSEYISTVPDGADAQFSALETLSYQRLEEMSIEDLVATLLKDAFDAEILSFRFDHFFMPLAAPVNHKVIQHAILSHFSDCFSRMTDGNCAVVTVKDLFSAVDRCLACAVLSRPSLTYDRRIIRDIKVLFEFIETSFTNLLQISCSLCLNEFQSRRLIDKLWDLYECLPTRLAFIEIEEIKDEHVMAEDMFEALVIISILCQWPGCHAFNLVQGAEGNELYERILRCLCQSFFSQVIRIEGEAASNQGKLSVLLSALISDIKELERIIFDSDFCIAKVITSELVLPLMDRKQVRLVCQLLDGVESKWIETDIVSQEVSSFINELLLSGGNVDSALEYQSLLSAHFPDVFQQVLDMQQSLEILHLVNSVLRVGQTSVGVTLSDITQRLPIDIIDDVLQKNPLAVICGCEDWADVKWAAWANDNLRDSSRGRNSSIEKAGHPELPGRLVLLLASLLGLSNSFEVSVIKYRLIVCGVSVKLFGAAAALCRSLYAAISKPTPFEISLILKSTAEIISATDYDDKSTMVELCESALVLSRQEYPLERFYEVWYSAFRKHSGLYAVTMSSNDVIPRPLHMTQRLVYDTLQQYNLRIGEIFCVLQDQLSQGMVDDTLLVTISRYILYWCIAQCTETKSYRTPAVEDAFVCSAVDSFVAFLRHAADEKAVQSLIQEAHAILEERSHSEHVSNSDISLAKPDPVIVDGLVHRGYSVNGARKSALATNNAGIDVALQWAVLHALNEGFDDPVLLIQNEKMDYTNVDGCQHLKDVLDHWEKRWAESSVKESHLDNMDDSWTAWHDNTDTLNVTCSDSTDDTSNLGSRSQGDNSAPVASFTATSGATVWIDHTQDKDSVERIQSPLSEPSTAASTSLNKDENERAPLRLETEQMESPQVSTASSPSAAAKIDAFASFVVSTPVSKSSPSRAALLETGQKALKLARSSASPSSEERKRLIEEGRKLLLLRGGLTPAVRRPYPRSALTTEALMAAPTTEPTADSRQDSFHLDDLSSTVAAAAASDTVATQVDAAPALNAAQVVSSEWDFDDDDLGDANGGHRDGSGDNDGWDFEEDLAGQ